MRHRFKKALETLLSNRQYVVINQNPLRGQKLDIEFPRPGKVEVFIGENSFSLHDDYGTWCSMVPCSVDLYKGELTFYVICLDDRDKNQKNRFLRTFRFVHNPSSPAWAVIEELFYKLYPDARKAQNEKSL